MNTHDWTLLKDSWPEWRQKVLAYCRDIPGSDPDFYYMVLAPVKLTKEGKEKYGTEMAFVDFRGVGSEHIGHSVIAWMPLPEPPSI